MYEVESRPFINTKWPRLIVVGEKISRDQAAEIIVRTTQWPLSSNNQDADKIFNNLIASEKEFKKGLFFINPLDLSHLHNQRITTCYEGGPKGWVDWEGNIFTNNYNIGKWPSVKEVTQDWEIIAKEFPFLKLKSQVLESTDEDSEDEKLTPTAEWILENGKVITQMPEKPLCKIQEKENLLKDICLWNAYEITKYFKNNCVGATIEDVKKGILLARKNIK